MLKTRMIIIGVLSLCITLLSPFIFNSYFEQQPEDLSQHLTFGGPIPFAEQKVILPSEEDQYPLEVKFESPFEKETKYKITPLLLSFVCFFLFLFAFYSIVARFFKAKPVIEPK